MRPCVGRLRRQRRHTVVARRAMLTGRRHLWRIAALHVRVGTARTVRCAGAGAAPVRFDVVVVAADVGRRVAAGVHAHLCFDGWVVWGLVLV